MNQHIIVFLDHSHAKLLKLDSTESKSIVTHSQHQRGVNQHSPTSFFAEITGAVRGTPEILIAGPGNAKSELLDYLDSHAPDVRQHVVGVETVDHPSDNQLRAIARKRFKAIDQWL